MDEGHVTGAVGGERGRARTHAAGHAHEEEAVGRGETAGGLPGADHRLLGDAAVARVHRRVVYIGDVHHHPAPVRGGAHGEVVLLALAVESAAVAVGVVPADIGVRRGAAVVLHGDEVDHAGDGVGTV